MSLADFRLVDILEEYDIYSSDVFSVFYTRLLYGIEIICGLQLIKDKTYLSIFKLFEIDVSLHLYNKEFSFAI